jgi:FKBP-type peptidyl-prolyl cis-trans isomerase FklB
MQFSTLSPKTMTLALCLATSVSLLAQDQTPAPKVPAAKSSTAAKPAGTHAGTTASKPLTTQKDKLSYSIGADIGKRLKADQLEVDPAIVSRGMRDAFSGAKLALTDDQIKATFTQLQGEMQAKRVAEAKAAAEKNKTEGDAYLAANKSKDGVVTLPSGLQYKILMPGSGPKPSANDTVVCNYRGTLVNGTEFDSSYKRGQPATFPVSGVIKGWTEALQLMPVGSKWQLVIPPDLAYGERGAGQQIGPDSTLVFEVELMSIQDKNADKAGDASKGAADRAATQSKPTDSEKPADSAKPADAPQDKQ